jgi:hypothetical protein
LALRERAYGRSCRLWQSPFESDRRSKHKQRIWNSSSRACTRSSLPPVRYRAPCRPTRCPEDAVLVDRAANGVRARGRGVSPPQTFRPNRMFSLSSTCAGQGRSDRGLLTN